MGMASHPTINIGTSYHNGQQPAIDEYGLCATTGEGQHFAEQIERALTVDPEIVFITSWNEWVAQRFISNGTDAFLGQILPPGGTFFVDSYNEEFNRDIEPMKGGHSDNYYYQLVDFVRRYKGVSTPQQPSPAKTISIDGNFAEWNSVTLELRDTIGDTAHRDWDGWGGLHYTNTTGRNDIISAKVCNDESMVYFYVETAADMTSHTDSNWMMLFIDSDLDSQSGWNGYDYAVNMDNVGADTTTLKRTVDGENWETIAVLSYKVNGNKMEIRVPRSSIDAVGDVVSFNFHWADNMSQLNDITQFFINGDSAPNRRFDYYYQTAVIPWVAVLAGDANFDGFVNELDAVILAENWLMAEGAAWSQGDFNSDGAVDDADAAILAVNWKKIAASKSVPEPGVLILLVGMLLMKVRVVATRPLGYP